MNSTAWAVWAALVGGGASILVTILGWKLGYWTRLDDARIKRLVDANLATVEARLNLATEWRLKLLERMLEGAGSLSKSLQQANDAALRLISAAETGVGNHFEHATVEALAAYDDVGLGPGLLDPTLRSAAQTYIGTLTLVLGRCPSISEESDPDKRRAQATAATVTLRTAVGVISAAFDAWYGRAWTQQENAFGALGSDGMAALSDDSRAGPKQVTPANR